MWKLSVCIHITHWKYSALSKCDNDIYTFEIDRVTWWWVGGENGALCYKVLGCRDYTQGTKYVFEKFFWHINVNGCKIFIYIKYFRKRNGAEKVPYGGTKDAILIYSFHPIPSSLSPRLFELFSNFPLSFLYLIFEFLYNEL